MVFVDGVYQPALSTAASSDGVQIDRLDVIADSPDRLEGRLAAHADWSDDPAIALSTMMITDGVMVEIAAGTTMDAPLHVIYLSSGHGQPISIHPEDPRRRRRWPRPARSSRRMRAIPITRS